VKFYAFNLMPYPELEDGFKEKYQSDWVTYPNSHFDPVRGRELYTMYIDQLVFAAEQGYDGVCVNEHHQTPYGLMPSPNLIAAMLVQRTKDTKVAILGNALPLRGNPLRLAEELAMLDVISGGRIISGFVRGIGAEYHSLGFNPAESRDRFREAHDVIVRAWSEPGPFSFEGEFFNYRYVNTWPRPFQQPHPEVWSPSTGSGETVVWAAERGYTYVQVFSPLPNVVKIFDEYRAASERFGRPEPSKRLGWNPAVYIADSDAQAEEEFWPHMDLYFNKMFPNPQHRLFPPNYMEESTLERVLQVRGDLGKERDFAGLLSSHTALVGSPETVIGMLEEAHDLLDFEHLVMHVHFGGLSDELTRKNIQRVAREIFPRFRDRRSKRASRADASVAAPV
jgi:alkanesulfonate monooxygenase SsuD/methylene tetrahydromethanopterin reductase-like flavin-dependent oxidoreductase (luciferase family)